MRPAGRRLDRPRIVQIAFALGMTLAISFFLEREDAPGERALALQARARSADVSRRVKVVRIDDADYTSLFGGRSPMDPSRIEQVIRAIAAGRPAVIGVDVESIDPAYAALPDSIAGVPIVWARVHRCVREGGGAAGCPPGERIPQPAAGREEPGAERAGFAMLAVESDGSVRRYERSVETSRGPLPSFATAILRHAGQPVPPEAGERPRLIRYRRIAGADSVFTARWVLDAARGEGFARNGVFRDRIVLLGGTFWQSRDRLWTPMGYLAGVEVQAQILETELDGGGPRPPGTLTFFILQFAVGFGIVVIFHVRRERGTAFLLSLILCLAAAPVASRVLFGTWSLWFYFLPAVCVWLVQQLYDEAKGYRDRLLLGGDAAPPAPHAIDVVGRLPPRPAAPANPAPSPPPATAGQARKRRRSRKRRSPRAP